MNQLTVNQIAFSTHVISQLLGENIFALKTAIMINKIGFIDTLASSMLVHKLINLLIDWTVLREFRIINFGLERIQSIYNSI